MAELSIREMTIDDVEEVHDLDEKCFSSPWTKHIYYREVKDNHFAHYFVIEKDEVIIGYFGLWIVADDAQITNIAVLPQYRGYGIGKHAFGFAMQYAIQEGAAQLSLEVRISNTVAQKMYESFGLKKGGIRKEYYPDNKEDAYVMWVNLI